MWSLVPPCTVLHMWKMCAFVQIAWRFFVFYPCLSVVIPMEGSLNSQLCQHSSPDHRRKILVPFSCNQQVVCLFSFMSHLPSVSPTTRPETARCPAKAALFCLCGPFYPCANRRGRVPELDPIFHAQLSFVWHTTPDKNPNSRASLILKSSSGVERAFNHPLSVLQWLLFNLTGSRLLITGPRAEAGPWKNPHPLMPVSHSSISIDIPDAVVRQPHIECCWEMSVKCHSSRSTGISSSLI